METCLRIAIGRGVSSLPLMKSIWVRLGMSVLCALVLGAAGCGGEKAAKVDLAAQLGQLSGDVDTKVGALAEIAKMGPGAASAVDKITPLLKDEDPLVRRTAAYTLGSIGPAAKAAVPQLKSMLQTTDRDQLTAVANALRAIEPSALPGLKVDNVATGPSE